MPSKTLEFKTPIELLAKFYPDINTSNNLTPKVFGCTSFVHVHSNNRGKLDPRAIKCVFLGYSSTQKGYKCYHPPTKRFFVTADVTFEEGTPYFTQPYLQGEQSLVGDKDRDNFLLEQQPLPMLVLTTQSTQTQSQNQSQHQSHHQSTQTQTQHQSHPIESHSQPNQSQFQPI